MLTVLEKRVFYHQFEVGRYIDINGTNRLIFANGARDCSYPKASERLLIVASSVSPAKAQHKELLILWPQIVLNYTRVGTGSFRPQQESSKQARDICSSSLCGIQRRS